MTSNALLRSIDVWDQCVMGMHMQFSTKLKMFDSLKWPPVTHLVSNWHVSLGILNTKYMHRIDNMGSFMTVKQHKHQCKQKLLNDMTQIRDVYHI